VQGLETGQERLQFRRQKPPKTVRLKALFAWPIWPWKRARVYRDLASMLRGGVSLYEAMDTMTDMQRGGLGRMFRHLNQAVKAGKGLGEAMAEDPVRIPPGDAALVGASEQVGQVPEALDTLADFYSFQVDLIKQNIFLILYPIVIYVLSLFMLNITTLLKYGTAKYFTTIGMGFLGLLIPAGVALFAMSLVPLRPVWRAFKGLAWFVPVVSIPLKYLATAMYAKGMAAGLNAGMGIDKTLDIADALANSPRISAKTTRIKTQIHNGETLFTALRTVGLFNTGELTSVKAAEKSGTLDRVFESISQERMSSFSMTAKILVYAMMLPFFVGMLGLVGYRLIQEFKQVTVGNLEQMNHEIMRQAPFIFK